MNDSWSNRFNDVKSRIKEAVGGAEGEVDVDVMMARVRESVGKAGSDVDAEALIARFKEGVGKAEGKVDASRIRQWVDEIDQDKLRGWLDEAKTGAGAVATFAGAQGERLAERAPGAIDKVIGVAKEAIGDFTGNEELSRQGELQHLKGDIEARSTEATETAEETMIDAADEVKSKVDDRND